jgi:hypothetical protein
VARDGFEPEESNDTSPLWIEPDKPSSVTEGGELPASVAAGGELPSSVAARGELPSPHEVSLPSQVVVPEGASPESEKPTRLVCAWASDLLRDSKSKDLH